MRSISMMGRSNKQANEAKAPLGKEADTSGESIDEALIAGASAMTDIENMIGELQDVRDYLRAEAERVMQANARYTHLAQARRLLRRHSLRWTLLKLSLK
jgi:hypothetical protein